MSITIASIGLATAQGSAAEILSGRPPAPPRDMPWPLHPRTRCRVCHPARVVPNNIEGPARWRALARAALDECQRSPRPGTPLVVASCNGGAYSTDTASWVNAFDARSLLAGTPWAEQPVPIVSGSCASGLHALFLAARLLTGDVREVIVLAVDILSPSNHDNFEALKVLATHPGTPWQATSQGFIPGEAAVALRVTRNGEAERGVQAEIPVLRQDLDGQDGLRDVVSAFRSRAHSVLVGQGTGPWAVDAVELSALDSLSDHATPITTPTLHFGHTLGASGLLSLSLAALAQQLGELPPALRMPRGAAGTGRPLADRMPSGDEGGMLVICRALSGACAATEVASAREPLTPWRQTRYHLPAAPEPAFHSVLRRITADASGLRPAAAPDVLLVRLEAPLVPAPSGMIGDRLLPHAVLEITPASIPRLIARLWGYRGPALCLVGDGGTESSADAIVAACRTGGETVAEIRVRGTGYERSLDWHVSPS